MWKVCSLVQTPEHVIENEGGHVDLSKEESTPQSVDDNCGQLVEITDLRLDVGLENLRKDENQSCEIISSHRISETSSQDDQVPTISSTSKKFSKNCSS